VLKAASLPWLVSLVAFDILDHTRIRVSRFHRRDVDDTTYCGAQCHAHLARRLVRVQQGREEIHRGGFEPSHHQGDTGVAWRAHGPDAIPAEQNRLWFNFSKLSRQSPQSSKLTKCAFYSRHRATRVGYDRAATRHSRSAPSADPCLVLAPDFKPLGFRMRTTRDHRGRPGPYRLGRPARYSSLVIRSRAGPADPEQSP
jgi:hypothetical protein